MAVDLYRLRPAPPGGRDYVRVPLDCRAFGSGPDFENWSWCDCFHSVRPGPLDGWARSLAFDAVVDADGAEVLDGDPSDPELRILRSPAAVICPHGHGVGYRPGYSGQRGVHLDFEAFAASLPVIDGPALWVMDCDCP